MTPFLVEFLVGRKLLPTLACRRERLYSRLRPARRARNVGSGGGGTCVRNRLESCPSGGVEGERSFERHCFDASGRVRAAWPRHVIVAAAAERSRVDLEEVSCGKVAPLLGILVILQSPACRPGRQSLLFSPTHKKKPYRCQSSEIRGQLIAVSRGSDSLRMCSSGVGVT